MQYRLDEMFTAERSHENEQGAPPIFQAQKHQEIQCQRHFACRLSPREDQNSH